MEKSQPFVFVQQKYVFDDFLWIDLVTLCGGPDSLVGSLIL